jgi:nucleotide-binding universal stress UspA family protein
MLRSLLLALDGIAPCEAMVETAAVLAEDGAAVELCLALDRAAIESPEAVALGGLHVLEHRQAAIEDRLRRGLNRVAEITTARLAAAGVTPEVRHLEGDVMAELPALALQHDLLLLSNALHPAEDDENIDNDFALSVAKLAAVTARPLLVANTRPLTPGPALVAYDGGRASARALHAAIHLGLLRERVVHVVTCGDQAESITKGAVALLRRHGLEAEAHAVDGSEDAAVVIIDHSETVGASLIVIGAFGERVLHHWLFGSTTDAILAKAEPPILLHS